MEKHTWIRTVYLYLVSLIGLVTFIIGAVGTLNIGLEYYVFGLKTPQWAQSPAQICEAGDYYDGGRAYPTKARNEATGLLVTPPTEEEKADCIATVTADQIERGKQEKLRSIAWSLSAIIVGLPVWLYHWTVIRRRKDA